MIKTLISSLLLCLSFSIQACEVHLPAEIILLNSNANIISSSSHTGCTHETLNALNDILNSVEGKITGFQISGLLKDTHSAINITPPLLSIRHFRNLLREHLALPEGVQLQRAQAVDAKDYDILNDGEVLSIACENCRYGANQLLALKVSGIDGSIRTTNVQADFKKLVRGYRIASFMPAFSEISAISLKEESLEATPHTDLVTDVETLKFYKLNKPLKAGDVLRQSDLSALSLVKAGVKTEVIIENALVRLKTSGISRSNGAIGEFVEVFHPQKNKKYLGKVIDINKVLVEL